MKVMCAYREMVNTEDLKPNPRNPNKHPQSQIKLLAKIIGETGWRSPIVVSNRSGYVVKGHGRLEAAILAGFESVPIDRQDYESDALELADMVADNRIAELAEMDLDALGEIMADLGGMEFDMELTGFDYDSLGKFDVQEVEAPQLADGDRAPFRQVTFTLHDEQFEEVEIAISTAKQEGGSESAVNENSNGNALAWICGRFNNGKR